MKIHFFNWRFKDVPRWQQLLLGLFIVFLFYVPVWLGYPYFSIPGIIAYLAYIGYAIWQNTRLHSFTYIKKDYYRIKLHGEVLHVDTSFLHAVWIKDHSLHIQRVNRVDSFSLKGIEPSDVDKLVHLLTVDRGIEVVRDNSVE